MQIASSRLLPFACIEKHRRNSERSQPSDGNGTARSHRGHHEYDVSFCRYCCSETSIGLWNNRYERILTALRDVLVVITHLRSSSPRVRCGGYRLFDRYL